MDDIKFVVRTFFVTIVLFLGMQIRIGSRTIEQHSLAWVHSSSFIESLQNVSDGAIHVFHVARYKATAMFTHLPAVGSQDAQGSHEEKRRVAKRADARKQNEIKAEEHPTGAFRSFFDVKTVHDEEAK